MPVTTQWHNDARTILLIRFEGRLILSDISHALSHGRALLDSADYPANIIVDFRNAQAIPPGVTRVFGQAKSLFDHANAELTQVVGANLMLRTFAKVFLQTFPDLAMRIEFVATMDDAYTRLAEFDSATER